MSFQRRPWTELSDVFGKSDMSFDEQIAVSEEIIAAFAKLGIPTKNSRIVAYRNALLNVKRRAAKDQNFDLETAMSLLGTSVEIQQLRLIAKAAASAQNVSEWRNQLERLVSGSHPSIPSRATAGFDFQYEAYLASVASLSGYNVCFREPDIIINEEDVVFGIAAKRPRRHSGFERNVARAVKQIRNSGIKGIIALDCSIVAADGKAITTTDPMEAANLAKELCEAVLKVHLTCIKDLRRHAHVLGVLFSIHLPVTIVDEHWQSATSFRSAFRWTTIPLQTSERDLQLILEFTKRCERALFETEAAARSI
jgi:hypothetical protein